MSNTNKNTFLLPMILGAAGFIAGIALVFMENRFIGIFGAIASAGVAYKGYQDWKATKD
ncbi:MAG: hypothetical protein AAF433_16495 [Bacteroidota bacterium]